MQKWKILEMISIAVSCYTNSITNNTIAMNSILTNKMAYSINNYIVYGFYLVDMIRGDTTGSMESLMVAMAEVVHVIF